MNVLQRIPRLIRFLILLTIAYIAVYSAARLAFWLFFDNPNDPLAWDDLLRALYLGLKFDLRLTLLIILPIFLLGWMKCLSPFEGGFGRKLWLSYSLLTVLGSAAFYIADFGHYGYLTVRLDSTALSYLSNPLISAQMVWESYPVLIWLTGLFAALSLTVLCFMKLQRRYAQASYRPLRTWQRAVLISMTLFLTAAGIYGKLSWYPLRWSDAFFTNHAFASTLAFNPVLYFYDTYKSGGLEYDEDAVRKHYPLIADYLGVDNPDMEKLSFVRQIDPVLRPDRPFNVIVVILESFASHKSGLSGNPLQPTPHFDRIAENSLYFRNFFTPTAGTARSVFTAITGLPDVQLYGTSSRNPVVVNQHVILDAFKGYEMYYFLGGSASWANMRAMLKNNISELHLYEEGSYESPRVDVWGISDLALFKEAHNIFQGVKKPFFAVIQTSGNHRPYTIPADNEGFEPRTLPHEELIRYGFHSLDEFNSYRFMDHSIGYFMNSARQSGYFDNTIFVFFGDHGISGDAGIHTHASETQLGLGLNRVPLVIHAPALFREGKTLDTVASEMDVMTSLASITGHSHINTTLGRDLFNPRFDRDRHAFIMYHAAQATTLGVVSDEFYFRMNLDGGGHLLQRVHAKDSRPNLVEQHPEIARRMQTLAKGLYESTRYIVNNNPKLEHPGKGAHSALE